MCISARTILLLIAVSLLGGCTSLRRQMEIDQTTERAMGAEPLADQYPVCRAASAGQPCTSPKIGYAEVQSDTEAKQWIGAAASDSVSKCMAFVARMAYGNNAVNTGLDITSIGLAGAAAITLPVRSAQTLAALAGISTATRAAIDSDLFLQNTAPAIAQKINSTYMSEMRTFLTQTSMATQANLPTMYGQLLTDHTDCTLMGALAAMGNGTNGGSSRTPLTAAALTVGAAFADPTTKVAWKVVAPGVDATNHTVTLAMVPLGTAFPASPPTAAPPNVDAFIGTLNGDGAFPLSGG